MELQGRAERFVRRLQDEICEAIEGIEAEAGGCDRPAGRFQEDLWERPGGGGGRTRVLAGGRVFEKAGVNVSAVFGALPEPLKVQLPGDSPEFFATGVSLVLHPDNPHVPTTHANFRYFQRGSVAWFGGGADLTPYFLDVADAAHFHAVLRDACAVGVGAEAGFYESMKEACDRYFWNPHRNEARGIGGIFYDHLRPGATSSADALASFWEASGEAFLPAYLPLVRRKMNVEFTEIEKQWQLQRRGRYVEFNLLHDRGTRFGLETGGRTESILMSLPPLVRWDYGAMEPPNEAAAALLEVLAVPRRWVAG